MNDIIPGILERDWSEIEKKLELVKPFAQTVHIDIIDGKFAENTTFLDPEPFKKYRDDFLLELHMMVENPISYVEPWAEAGFKRFLGQIEKMPDQEEFLNEAKKFGEAGLAIDGPTDLSNIQTPFNSLATLLFMSITAGFSGQEFNSSYLLKIHQANSLGFTGIAEVDGGINDKTIIEAKNLGATRFVSTSHLFNAQNLLEEFNTLKQAG